VELAREELED